MKIKREKILVNFLFFFNYYYYAAVKTICMLKSYRNTGRQGVTCAPASETRVKR